MDGRHAGGEEERGDHGAVGVVEDVERGEELIPDREAGAEEGGGRLWVGLKARGKSRDNVGHV